MASLLSWAKKEIQGGLQTVKRDVVAPVQHAAASTVHQAQGAVAQVNPIDSGRTYHTVMQQGPAYHPQVNTSGMHQLTHNGATNVVGGVAKGIAAPFAYLGAADIVNPTRELAAQFSHNPVAYRNAVRKSNETLGLGADGSNLKGGLRKWAGNTAQVGLSVATPGVGKVIDKSFTAVAPKIVPKIITKAVSNAGTGAIAGAPFNAASYVTNADNPTLKGTLQAAKQGAQAGAVLGAGGTVVGAAAPVVAKVAVKGAKKVTAEPAPILELRAKKAATIKAMDTAKPGMMQNLVANVNSIDSQIKAIKQGGYLELPGKKPNASVPNGKSLVPQSQKISSQLLPEQPGKIGRPVDHQVGVTSVNNTTLPQINPVTAAVKKTQSVLPNSRNITPAVKNTLDKNYVSHSFTAQLDNANKAVAKNLSKSTDTALALINKKSGTMSDADHQFVSTVAANLDAKGSKVSQQLAGQLYNGILEHRAATAQTFAAFRDISNNNPGVLKAQAINYLKKHGNTELDKAGTKQLDSLITALKKTQLGTTERDMALHNVISFVSSKIPTSAGDKIVNFWRAGLLTSPITTGGNILGNAGEAAVRNAWVNPVATAVDIAQSLVTGKRTKTMAGGQIQGGIQGAKQAGTYLKTGFDPNNLVTKFEGKGDINYGTGKLGKATGGYVNGVYRGLGAQDKPFRQAATNQAAIDLAKADAKNLKLNGKAKSDYIKAAASSPDWKPQTFTTANDSKAAGAFSVFANETALGKTAQIIKQPFTIGGKTYNGAVRQFILPFTQVPASIAMRIIHRSDLGAGEIINQIMRVRQGLPYDQRAVSEAIGNGTFGPAAIGAGYALSKSGNITGNYPTDPKEKAIWKSEGKQANSVRVGNRWYSLNYMQPFGTLLGIGDQIHQDEKSGKTPTEIVSNASGRAAKSVESQSFLQGVDGLLSAVNDPQRSAKQYVNSTASSVVPNFIRTTARATDPQQRATNNVTDALKGTIPGLRETVPAAQDMFGANLKAVDNPANQLFNPLRPSLAKTKDPVVNELQRLQDTQNGIIPTKFDKTAIPGTKLSDQQVRDLNSQVNAKVKTAWQGVMSDPRYAALSDEEKATALKRAKDQIGAAYKRQFSADNNLTSGLEKKASASSVKILDGKSPDFLKKGSSSSLGSTPADKYKTAQDNFNQNQSTMSDVAKYAAQKSLTKMKVAAPFSNDVLSLYSMSKTDAANYLASHPNSQKLADQVTAYDQALVKAGVISKPKYSSGSVATTKTSKSGGSGRKSTGGGKAGVSKLTSIVKATKPKGPKKVSAPHFTVKTTGTPASYRKATLKQYAVVKPTVSKTKRA